jgi:predicted PurR-regulated permease PerM
MTVVKPIRANCVGRARAVLEENRLQLMVVNVCRSARYSLSRVINFLQRPPRQSEIMLSRDTNGLRHVETPALPFDSRTRAVTRAAISVLVVLFAAWVARDFLAALIWAALIAIAAWPIYIRFATHIPGNRPATLAALLFTFLTGLVLLVPIVLTVHQIAQGSDAFARSLIQLRQSGIPVPAWLVRLPVAGEYLDLWWRANLGNPEVLVQWLRGIDAENITAWTSTLGGALLHRLFLFLVTLIALFMVLRDGVWLADHALATAGRLLGNPGERLVRKIADAVRATVNGTVAASIVKGAVIGVAYGLTGVPHALLFAVLTMTLAMVPLGAWAALATAVLALLVNGGALLMAAGLAGFGVATLLIAENIIQPALIGGAARLPFLLVLIGIIGGMQSFGLLGLFLGPVIMAALLTIWREWIGVGD